jgi:O-antigen/teichoic acid export membrane protein
LTGHFQKNIFILIGGAAIAQLLGIVASIILARIYSPSDFGVLALVNSAVGFFCIAASGRYELGFMIAENYAVIRSLFILIIRIILIVSFVCFGGYWVYIFLSGQSIESTISYLTIAPAVLAASWTQVNIVFLTREKYFKSISAFRIVEVSANVIPALLLGSLGAFGLVSAYLISQTVLATALSVFVYMVWKKKYQKLIELPSPSISNVAKKFIQFPRYNVSQGLLDAFQMSGVLWIGSSFLSLTAMGFYSIVMRFLQLPFGLIIRPLAQVYFGEISEAFRSNKPFYEFSKGLAMRLALYAIPLLFVFPFIAKFIFELVLGKEWAEAGALASVLAFWIVADSIRAPLSQIPIVLSLQKRYLTITLLGTFIVFIVFALSCIMIPQESYFNVFLFFTVIQFFFNSYLIYYCLQLARKHDAGLRSA